MLIFLAMIGFGIVSFLAVCGLIFLFGRGIDDQLHEELDAALKEVERLRALVELDGDSVRALPKGE